MNLSEFMFPIVERPVAVYNGQTDFTDWDNPETYLPNDYKCVVREDTNEAISIVRNSYKIVPNEELINKLMHELLTLDTPFKVDPSHSFVDNNRMRLQVTFPEITINDSESEIACPYSCITVTICPREYACSLAVSALSVQTEWCSANY